MILPSQYQTQSMVFPPPAQHVRFIDWIKFLGEEINTTKKLNPAVVTVYPIILFWMLNAWLIMALLGKELERKRVWD